MTFHDACRIALEYGIIDHTMVRLLWDLAAHEEQRFRRLCQQELEG